MRLLNLAVYLAAIGLAANAGADTYRGLGLDHPALHDDYYGLSWSGPYANQAPNAQAKGVNAGASTVAFVRAGIRAGTSRAYIATSGGDVDFSGGPKSTLFPPFADGHIFGYTSGIDGFWIEAHIYEPDTVKRKTNAGSGKSRVQLKQKSYLAIRFGMFQGSVKAPNPAFLYIDRCKGQADVRTDPGKGTRSVKLKVNCSGSDPGVQSVRSILGAILGKAKSSFELRGSYPIP